MKRDVFPGAKCRIVGSARGPEGASIGRVVRAVGLSDPPIHVVWGDMWDCEALDGKMFEVKITSPDMQSSRIQHSNNCVCAADWLEVIEDDPTLPAVEKKHEELTE